MDRHGAMQPGGAGHPDTAVRARLCRAKAGRRGHIAVHLLAALAILAFLVSCEATSEVEDPGPGGMEAQAPPAAGPELDVAQPPETGAPPQAMPADPGRPQAVTERHYWPTEAWRTSTPEEQGMDPAALERMVAEIEENEVNIDSAIVVRHGYIVLEEYRQPYGPEVLHHLQSVTKSFTSMLIGIALHEGLIDGVDQRMVDLFPDHTIQNMDARKERITLKDLLTMSDGMDWHELDYPYDDGRNTLGQMWTSPDAVQHVLDRPMAREPGERWAYNSGTSILLGGILEQVTQRDVLEFANAYLFDPIGIGNVQWTKTTGNHYHTDGGLWMTPRDMARFGYLMLNMGTWDGHEVVTPEWVEQSTTEYFQTPWGDGYGYQWWIQPSVGGYAATGHHEQKIYVVPRADLVAVFTANIADEDPHPTDAYLARHILPACTDLPELNPAETYAEYGLALDYPLGARLIEMPLPGQGALSEQSGMVQFSSLYPPLELVNVVWEQAQEGVDLLGWAQDLHGSLGGTEVAYEWGESSQLERGEHDLLIQFFEATIEGTSFSGIMGVWHCPESGRNYMLTYSVTPAAAAQDVLEGLQRHREGLSCHGVD